MNPLLKNIILFMAILFVYASGIDTNPPKKVKVNRVDSSELQSYFISKRVEK